LDNVLFLPGLGINHSAYNLILPSIPEAEKVVGNVKATKGVKSARLELVSDRIECYGLLTEQVGGKLKTFQRADRDR
jgi:hypothetical protein